MVLAAALVTKGLWADPAGRALGLNANDQALDERFRAYATRAYRGDFHLVTGALNAPPASTSSATPRSSGSACSSPR